MSNYLLAQLDEIPTQRCPCGVTRRAFIMPDNPVATVHLLDVQTDAQKHYHKTLTEIYLILEGTGQMELDDEIVPVKPMTAILIKPGCRHRAIGNLRVIIIPIPAFDPTDEWFD
jgi:mannose-6-phosphate isomerase-like protein (cupin superfamily)